MKPWPRTLGVQLIVVTAVAIFLSNAGVALWFGLRTERQNQADLTERMLDRTSSLASVMGLIPAKARVAAADAMEGRLWHYRIQTGRVDIEPMSPEEAKLAARLRTMLPPRTARMPLGVHFRDWHGDPKDSTRSVEMSVPVVRGTQLIVTFVIPADPSWPPQMALAAIVAALFASAAAAYLAQRVARPLSKLAHAAGAVAQGETAPNVPEVGPEDVRNAARAFNTMANQVSRTMESQRHLLSAVGHDLRTPITAMRINIEFVEDPELRDRLQKNLEELQELTEAVLSAAKGTGGEPRRQIDLASLTESVCADLDDIGEPVVWRSHDPAPVSCRANEMRRAIRNLVENAVAYGGNAEVSIREIQGAYEVVVEDNGPGIAPEDRVRVFEPFVRLESSRNLDTGGTGLGLTLVKAIAEGHGGKVVLEDRPGGKGLRARLIVPRQGVLSVQRQPNEAL